MITGPGYAASTFTATPKSASLRSISRDVYSSVSALTVSWLAGGSSSRSSGGSGESGNSWNSGRCFSRTTRSDFGTSTTGGTTSTGSRGSSMTLDSTMASRSADACAPSLRSSRSSARRRAQPNPFSIAAPMRSIRRSHDMPEKSDQPTANSASSSSVAPLKPTKRARPLPARSPIAPPGASGSVAGRR